MKTKKAFKFTFAYVLATAIYYVFDYVYLPWLGIKFGFTVFAPLYSSIVIVNFLGVYLYDFLKEDVLFLELGKNWIKSDTGRLLKFKKYVRESKRLTFIALSIWPSPIASYLFFRKSSKKQFWQVFGVIAIGSIYCTAVYGGVLGLFGYLFKLLLNYLCIGGWLCLKF